MGSFGAGAEGGVNSLGGSSGVSTPEWPPRPVSDLMGPESASRDGVPEPGGGDGIAALVEGGGGGGGGEGGEGGGGEGGGGGDEGGSDGLHARPGFFQGRRAGIGGASGGAARGGGGHHHARDSDRSSAGAGGPRRGPVNIRNEHGNTALAVAAALQDASVAAELTVGLSKLNAVYQWLESAWFQPLSLKCDNPVSKFAFTCNLYRYITGVLLEHGASPLVLSGGWTPLHWAAQQGNAAAAAAMAAWEGGRAVDARSADAGDTPLMVAASSGRVECCRALLHAGADALTVNTDGAGLLSQVAAKVSRGSRSKVRAHTRAALLRAAPQLRGGAVQVESS
jgi:hypothetical protein